MFKFTFYIFIYSLNKSNPSIILLILNCGMELVPERPSFLARGRLRVVEHALSHVVKVI